jgi:hypothetical protein
VQGSEPAKPGANALGYREPLITAFKVYPNPSSGEFAAEVLLREPADIRLSLFSLSSSARLDDRRASGSGSYSLEYRMGNLPSGMYIMLLTAGGEHRQVKIIKK